MPPAIHTSLSSLHLQHRFADLGDAFSTAVHAEPLHNIELASYSPAAGQLLDLPADISADAHFIPWLSGQQPWPGARPVAQVYSGHQFGVWAGQLGDGRALLLGEVENRRGELWEIQLKGAGSTPYSRGADGRAVLRSTIREYLCSEAMAALGVPTTRALALFASDTPVYRESVETAALLVRLAPSHLRFGHFEHFYHRRQHAPLAQLIDYAIAQHFPACADSPEPELALLQAVVERTARLVAHWQALGFCHGVMNTDNMSLLGLTLDYGPFGFIEQWDAGHICNHSDVQGRYAFNRQPQVGLWNLQAWASCLLPWVEEAAIRTALEGYSDYLDACYKRHLLDKLGLQREQAGDEALVGALFTLLQAQQPDYTHFFRALSHLPGNADSLQRGEVTALFADGAAVQPWLDRYQQRLQRESCSDAQRHIRMQAVNPKYILRNYLAQQAIDKAKAHDYTQINTLLRVLSQPYAEQPEHHHYSAAAPPWAKDLVLTCSA